MRVRAMREDRGRFASVRDARVLIYWPHGLGDWVHFGAVAPLLEPSNSYAITRFGDDYVSVMEDAAGVRPLYSGVRVPGDGAAQGAEHLGLTLRRCNGQVTSVALPAPLGGAVIDFDPAVVLWTDYPETEGMTAFPFHTKARNVARLLVRPQRLAALDLGAPLRNAMDFAAPSSTQRRVDECLARFAPPGTKLCAIARRGVTASRKNWGDGSEAAAFVAALRRRSHAWRFVSMDDEASGASVAGFRSLFSELDEPFARVYKALAKRTDLFVGIPAGPLHLTLARGGVPTVALWHAHHPDWYDEPNAAAIHLVARYVRDRGFDRRPATTTKPPGLRHRIAYLDGDAIEGAAVVEAAEEVLR